MRILFVSGFFPPFAPASAIRAPRLVDYLLGQGHDVHVLAPAHDRFAALDHPDLPSGRIHWTASVDTNWPPRYVPAVPGKSVAPVSGEAASGWGTSLTIRRRLGAVYRTVAAFPDRTVGWVPFGVRAGLRLCADWAPDLIYVTAPPHSAHLAGRHLSRKLGVPWIAELRDLWTDDPYYHHPPQPRWRTRVERWLEGRTLSTARALVAVTEGAADLLRARFSSPVAVIMNGFDSGEFGAVDARRGTASSGPLNILYTGTVYPGRRDPSLLFKAMAKMPDLERQVKVQFYGASPGVIGALATEFGVSAAVEIHERVSRKTALRMQQQADVLLLLTWPTPAEDGIIPAKLFDYIGAGRPILALGNPNGEAARIVRNHGFGSVSSISEEVVQDLSRLYDQKQSGALTAPVPEVVRQLFQRDRQFAKLDPLFAEAGLA